MREIKFRAWDKKGRTMYFIALRDMLENKANLIMNCDDDVTAIMEYTGLHDKNAKEIYEGDILELADNFPAVVEWNHESGKWQMKELGQMPNEYAPRTHDMDAYTFIPPIIGDIHRNPELLQQ